MLVHWFIVDETNRDYAANHFFIVGGLVFTAEQIELVDPLEQRQVCCSWSSLLKPLPLLKSQHLAYCHGAFVAS